MTTIYEQHMKETSRRYLNESHRRYTEATMKAVKEMSKRELSREEMMAQCNRITVASRNTARTPTSVGDWGRAYHKFVARQKFLGRWPFPSDEERKAAWREWVAYTMCHVAE